MLVVLVGLDPQEMCVAPRSATIREAKAQAEYGAVDNMPETHDASIDAHRLASVC